MNESGLTVAGALVGVVIILVGLFLIGGWFGLIVALIGLAIAIFA